jgi:hypothetical protein
MAIKSPPGRCGSFGIARAHLVRHEACGIDNNTAVVAFPSNCARSGDNFADKMQMRP